MTALVVIPARWHSQRFPGKPLALVAGVPLLERVISLARRETENSVGVEVVVATDDDRVERLAASLSCRVVQSDAAISCGTSRAHHALHALGSDASTIVNLQGDAPFVPAGAIRRVIAAVDDGAQVATPLVRLSWAALDRLRLHKLQVPFSGTTCARAPDGRAWWFSKQIIPAIRQEREQRVTDALSPVFRHIGLYGYTREALRRFDATEQTELERQEGLEQLRFFAAEIPIQTVMVEPPIIEVGGIDSPQDVAAAETLIAQFGDPHRP